MKLFTAFILLCLISSSTAFNITKILDQHPNFSNFNSFLSQTRVADEINRRRTITVLAVDNGAVSSLSGQPVEVLKWIMSVHVVLDYYDTVKLKSLSKKPTILTTLFQSSGIASNQQGFLKLTALKSGNVVVGSAAPGADVNINFVDMIYAQPFNVSVLQISSVIVPPGLANLNLPVSPPPKRPAAPAPTPEAAASPPAPAHKKPPTPKKAPAPTPEAAASPPAPTPTPKKAPSPISIAPQSDSPAPGPSDVADKSDSPAPSPPAPPADGPVDADAADSPDSSPDNSGSTAMRVSVSTMIASVMGMAAIFSILT